MSTGKSTETRGLRNALQIGREICGAFHVRTARFGRGGAGATAQGRRKKADGHWHESSTYVYLDYDGATHMSPRTVDDDQCVPMRW